MLVSWFECCSFVLRSFIWDVLSVRNASFKNHSKKVAISSLRLKTHLTNVLDRKKRRSLYCELIYASRSWNCGWFNAWDKSKVTPFTTTFIPWANPADFVHKASWWIMNNTMELEDVVYITNFFDVFSWRVTTCILLVDHYRSTSSLL